MSEDLCDMAATALVAVMRTKRVSPREVTDAVLARNVAEAVRLANAHITHTSTLVSQVARRHEIA